jgi:hypothetical protein
MSNVEITVDYQNPATASAPRSRRASRLPIVIVMILALIGSAGTRQWAEQYRQTAVPTRGGEASVSASLGGMNSFALGLLLGGLRGPLVMILWTESENAKTEKDLEGVDTMIEWIPFAAGVRHRPYLPDLEQGLQHLRADGQHGQQV